MDWQHTFQTIRQFSLPRTRALRQELEAVRAEHAQVSAELGRVREEYTRTRDSDYQQIAALQLQLNHIELDRDNARNQTQLLEASLQQASRRQEQTEQRMRILEMQLEEARQQHESNLYLTRDVLQRMQSEQKSLLSQQSDTAQTFQQVSHEMLKSMQEQLRPRLSVLQMSAVAGLLFLSGALATALVLHDARDSQLNLAGISRGISELQLLMEAHFRTHEELLEKLTRALERFPQAPLPDTGLLPPERKGGADHAGIPLAPPADQNGMVLHSGPVPPATGEGHPATVPQSQSIGTQSRVDLQMLGLLPAAARDAQTSAQEAATALQQFRVLYRQESIATEELQQVLHDFAVLARADADKYKLKSGVVAAIRLASLRTGVEFSYLMELASIESNFNPRATAKTSTASGLYQFKEGSWLEALKLYGDRCALGAMASRIEYVEAGDGSRQPRIADSGLQERALALRFDPHYAALLTAEQVRDSRERLYDTLAREPRRTDLYLTHFFGNSGAISFLKALDENPDQIAGDIFPGPAQRNRNIFHKRDKKPRTVAEIYQLLDRKFNTDRYKEG